MNDFMLSRKDSDAIKGLSIIMVVLHHFEQSVISVDLLHLFKGFGPIACSAFFFLSGYGLTTSQTAKNASYWFGRFSKILIPFVLSNMLYMAYAYNHMTVGTDLLLYLFGIKLINSHCWFIQVLCLMYLGYALSGKNIVLRLLLPTVLGLAYMIGTKSPGTASWIAFPLGIWMATYKPFKGDLTSIGVRVGSLIVFVCSAYVYYTNHFLINSWPLLINFALLVLTSPIVMLLIRRVLVPVPILLHCGKQSMNYYLMHGLCLNVLTKIADTHHYILLAVYVVSVFVVSQMFRWIIQKIMPE